MKRTVYLIITFVVFLYACKGNPNEGMEEEQSNIEDVNNNFLIKNRYVLQVYNENLSWASTILNHSGVKIEEGNRVYVVKELLQSHSEDVRGEIIELGSTFADTSNIAFLIDQLSFRSDSIVGEDIFGKFPQRNLFEIISLEDIAEYKEIKGAVYQMSNVINTKTGGLVFVVTHCWINDVKKEWLSAFKWNDVSSKYDIYLAVGTGEGDELFLEFSKNGFEDTE